MLIHPLAARLQNNALLHLQSAHGEASLVQIPQLPVRTRVERGIRRPENNIS